MLLLMQEPCGSGWSFRGKQKLDAHASFKLSSWPLSRPHFSSMFVERPGVAAGMNSHPTEGPRRRQEIAADNPRGEDVRQMIVGYCMPGDSSASAAAGRRQATLPS